METFFISYSELQKRFKNELCNKFDENLVKSLIEMGLITCLYNNGISHFLEEEVFLFKDIVRNNDDLIKDVNYFFGYRCDLFFDVVKLGKETYIRTTKGVKKQKMPSYIKNACLIALEKYEPAKKNVFYDVPGGILISNNQYIINYLEQVEARRIIYKNARNNDFANTSTYMGIKRAITDFIVESIIPHCNEETAFLDIMCGSGSVSSIFAMFGKTYASDAQRFCTLLAKVQGKGLNIQYASKLLDYLYPFYIQNVKALNELFGDCVLLEDDIFHIDTANVDDIYNLYQELMLRTKLYSSTDKVTSEIFELINSRKCNKKMFPYCLFSTYFANIYFGIQQCIQLDSLRFAIDQVVEINDQEWLLGILVISASVVATNYGGHFAQPKKVERSNVVEILEKRKISVWLEFSKRLIEIASESEQKTNDIVIIPGPCENVLKWLERKRGEELIVYLDAPYKRDDYSRYYHVLETLVLYDYPSAEYKGRNRSISKGERFQSEFSTRTVEKIENALVHIVTKVLETNNICVWNYSNNGNASIINVINRVKKFGPCDVFIYETSHRHVGQGSSKKRVNKNEIIEYCVVFKTQLPSAKDGRL